MGESDSASESNDSNKVKSDKHNAKSITAKGIVKLAANESVRTVKSASQTNLQTDGQIRQNLASAMSSPELPIASNSAWGSAFKQRPRVTPDVKPFKLDHNLIAIRMSIVKLPSLTLTLHLKPSLIQKLASNLMPVVPNLKRRPMVNFLSNLII